MQNALQQKSLFVAIGRSAERRGCGWGMRLGMGRDVEALPLICVLPAFLFTDCTGGCSCSA